MLQEQIIPIDFGGGLDTKTDPKLIVPGKFLSVQNGVFTSPKRVTKRNGYSAMPTAIAGGGNLVSPQLVREYLGEIVCADQGSLYAFSEQDNVWINKGNYASIEVSRDSVDQTFNSTGYVDTVIIGNYELSVWAAYDGSTTSTGSVNTQTSNYVQVKDLLSDVQLKSTTTNPFYTQNISGANPMVRAIILASNIFGIIYINESTHFLVLRTVTVSGSGTFSVSAETNIVAATQVNFDVTGTASGAAVAIYKSNGFEAITIDSSGAVTHTATFVVAAPLVNAGVSSPIFISASANNGYYWLYYCTASNISYVVLSSTLATVLAPTVLFVNSGSPGIYKVNIVSYDSDANTQLVYYGYKTNPNDFLGGSAGFIFQTGISTATNVGVVTSVNTIFHVVPYSRPILYNSVYYAVFVYIGNDGNIHSAQMTFFLLRLDTLKVMARFAYGVANLKSYHLQNLNEGIGYTPNLSLFSNKVTFPCGVVVQVIPFIGFFGANPNAGLCSSLHYVFDFNSINSYGSVISQGVLALGGGYLKMYDGASAVELGFHTAPEITTINLNSGGSLSAGVYNYIVIYQWTDNQGNQHQSAPSLPVSVTSLGSQSAIVNVLSPVLTDKTNVNMAVFRTQINGTVYYEVSNPNLLTTFGAAAFASFNDGAADSAIVDSLQAYTYPSSVVLENTPAAPATKMVSHNNRLWFIDDEARDTIWYTKTGQDGVGISASGFLTIQIDSKLGNISSVAEMDDKLVAFKDNGLCVMSGDGANDTGTGSSLSTPQFVPSDVGCNSFKSCITTPMGVMFQSPKGIYLLGRSLGVQYIGMDVEQFNDQIISAATLISGHSQIRFLTSSGTTLIYDYMFGKWGTFTNHTGVSSDNWAGTYVYATTGGKIYKENPGSYLDDATAFNLTLQTGWLALGSVQGFQRVRRLIMLGDYANGVNVSHGMDIQIAYDFSTTFSSSIPFTFGAASSSGAFQYRERLPRQKCDAISLLISESSTGNSSEYIDLTNISFEAGVKKGVNKLSAANSAG